MKTAKNYITSTAQRRDVPLWGVPFLYPSCCYIVFQQIAKKFPCLLKTGRCKLICPVFRFIVCRTAFFPFWLKRNETIFRKNQKNAILMSQCPTLRKVGSYPRNMRGTLATADNVPRCPNVPPTEIEYKQLQNLKCRAILLAIGQYIGKGVSK